MVYSARYLDLIETVVGLAAAQGICSILDVQNIDGSAYQGGDGAPIWATARFLRTPFPPAPS